MPFKTPEERAALRESGKAPFGQLPVLEVDGKIIAQTGAIARYCGKQGGFYPRDDDVAAAQIDMIIDTATDITMALGKTMGMEQAAKMEARAKLGSETLPMYFKALEKMMTDNGSTGIQNRVREWILSTSDELGLQLIATSMNVVVI